MREVPDANIPGDQRQLAAIVFTDVVGYSARMHGDETGTMALARMDFARMRTLATEHQGEVLKSTGDGLLICFASVVQAVACALQVQREFASRPPGALQHRIGIHLGDVFRSAGDATGDGVNLAARFQTRARPGTVCISQSVYDAVRGKLPMRVEPLGGTHFKNIAEPITVFLVQPAEEGGSSIVRSRRWALAAGLLAAAGGIGVLVWSYGPGARPGPAPAAAAAVVNPKSIAVLPFENMSVDKDNAFFADGVHEDVLTNLSFIRDLHVVSRTSVMQYRNTTKSIRQIGRELGVAYILEGSVRREGNKVRVTGQLVDARIDEHVWARSYDRAVTDIFAIQGELAQAIAGELQSAISPEARILLARRPTENSAAYDEYLKAREMRDSGGLGEERKAVALLEDAVRLDPKFASAWAELASQRAFLNFTDEQTQNQLRLAKEAIDDALRIAPDDPDVIAGLGDYYYYGYRDYARATEQYMRLEELRPNDAVVFSSLARIQRRQGRFADAVSNLRRAVALDPNNRDSFLGLAETLEAARDYKEAETLLRADIGRHPDDTQAAWRLSQCVFRASGSLSEIEAFAHRTADAPNRGLLLYLQLQNAQEVGDWAEAARLDGEQRHFENTEDPRWNQEINAAEAFAESGDMAAARVRAAESLAGMKDALVVQPNNAQLWADMSLANALLGEREAALICTQKSAELLPEARDALIGPINSCRRVHALAWIGEKDKALAEIERLLHVPYGLNIYSAKASFRPLRSETRFGELVADAKNNEPLY